MPDLLTVNAVPFRLVRLLGKGKGGYSWLAERDGRQYVLKQLHHEPCDYYQFGDKLAAERRDYDRLVAAGIPVPKLLDVDAPNERILKAYVPGPTIFELVRDGGMRPEYLDQVRALSSRARDAGLNLDWFPTNFVPDGGALWYVDYECNAFMAEWSFETWGVRYWSRTPEFEAYLAKTRVLYPQERSSPARQSLPLQEKAAGRRPDGRGRPPKPSPGGEGGICEANDG